MRQTAPTSRKNLPNAEPAFRCVQEYLDHKSASGRLRDSVLETALYLEDALGITLGDDDLCDACLGTDEAVLRLVVRKSTEL